MTLIDRLLLGNFLKAWLVCFISLVSLYLVIDVFAKFDDFLEAGQVLGTPLTHLLLTYYGNQVILIFDRLCGMILLLAAIFSITWAQRNNELLPLLSAGVPIRRILRPIFLGTLLLLGLQLANREWLMPKIGEKLLYSASDPAGMKLRGVIGAYEPSGIYVDGWRLDPAAEVVKRFAVTVPARLTGVLAHVVADEARYLPPSPEHPGGGWLLTNTVPNELAAPLTNVFQVIDSGKFFFPVDRVNFDRLARNRVWYQYAATSELLHELEAAEPAHLAMIAVVLHQRLVLPAVTLLMVVLGMGLVLRDQCRNLYINAALCLLLATLFYATTSFTRYLGDQHLLEPALAAWLPVLAFGPLAVVLFDAMHT